MYISPALRLEDNPDFPTGHVYALDTVLNINNSCIPKERYSLGVCIGGAVFPVRYELPFYMLYRLREVIRQDCNLKKKKTKKKRSLVKSPKLGSTPRHTD
jgi:hypothetical protein